MATGRPSPVAAIFLILFKAQCHEIFDLWFFSSNSPIWAPDSRVKAFSNMASNSRSYPTSYPEWCQWQLSGCLRSKGSWLCKNLFSNISLQCELSCGPSCDLAERMTYYTVCTQKVFLQCELSCGPSGHLAERMTYYTVCKQMVSLLCEISCDPAVYLIAWMTYYRYTVCTQRVSPQCEFSCARSVYLNARMTDYTVYT
jgi:hypothetical protein